MDRQPPGHPAPDLSGMAGGAGSDRRDYSGPRRLIHRTVATRSIFAPRIGRHLRALPKQEGRNNK